MVKINNYRELESLRVSLGENRGTGKPCITVCGGTGCQGSGTGQVIEAFHREVKRQGLQDHVDIKTTGCHGFCEQGPVVVFQPRGIFYCRVRSEDVAEIVKETVARGRVMERLLYTDPYTGERLHYRSEIPFYKKQQRVVFKNNGIIDPTSIEDYISLEGYNALSKVLDGMAPVQVIEVIKSSGLRGRGGAGFPTGKKWEFCHQEKAEVKYIVCNADEGDPGAYMDRSLLEGNPHLIIEGMIIGAYAMGAIHGFIYVRTEYPQAVRHIQIAIQQAKSYGFLGKDILSSGFSFDIEIIKGAGAFVAGEETSLMTSIEGKRGMPRQKPPFPAQRGIWGKPTNINNVETWATVPIIIEQGAEWYRKIGTEKSTGTKIFSLVGKINNTGLIEVPMGIELQEIIYGIGGGIPGQKKFKAVQTGGPSGGCIPKELLSLPVDYEKLAEAGSIMGSGGMVVMDEDTCMVDLARYFLNFLQEESCGKCLPCRIGIPRMLEILERISLGKGQERDISHLEKLAQTVKTNALCGLGQTAANSVLSTLRYFREEYINHIRHKFCSASICAALFTSRCKNTCPAGIDVPRYIEHILEGNYKQAAATILEKIPFPAVCGRICHAPCEGRCERGMLDEPVDIRTLKRAAGDKVANNGFSYEIYDNKNYEYLEIRNKSSGKIMEQLSPRQVEERARKPRESIAIIGAGPAGLTAAYFLAGKGYRPTIFEALPVAGGMLAVGVPEYRLPKRVLNREIEAIKNLGVEIKCGVKVGEDIKLDQLRKEYQCVFISVGAQEERRLSVPGEDLDGVLRGVDFLKELNLSLLEKRDPDFKINFMQKNVVVVGGGNVAIDVARSVRRLGAGEVVILYRRERKDMPAQREEIEHAEEEGIQILCSAAPHKITGENGKVAQVVCQRMRPGKFDLEGRRKPEPQDSFFTIDAGVLITAIGQTMDKTIFYQNELLKGENNWIAVETHTLKTPSEGVFAGGDCIRGPQTAVQAMADGQRAALTMDYYLRTGKIAWIEEEWKVSRKLAREVMEEERKRIPSQFLENGDRLSTFKEVNLGFSDREAREEALRCLRCDAEKSESD